VPAFQLPRQPFEDLIAGVAMDLDHDRYDTIEELLEYCRRVASAVGLVCIEIFGCRDVRSREYAINLGLALQLTNIVRDVGVDLSRGRVYLPQQDLRRFGCTEEALARGVVTQPIRALLAFEVARAREYFQRAALALPRSDARRLVAA
jgi:phytoene synthase